MFPPFRLPEPMDRLPDGLRQLLEAELADGNTVVEIGGPPAPPVGISVRLSRPVSAARRRDGPGFTFFDRNSSLWSGEFTDANRHHFVLEPPRPQEPEPDMDAIRARANPVSPRQPAQTTTTDSATTDPVARFAASRRMDFHKWKEGEGYDLAAIEEAAPDQRFRIQAMLLASGVDDWRDVEALAALRTPEADEALLRALDAPRVEVRLAVLRFAPRKVTAERRTEVLVTALESVKPFEGLTEAIALVTRHHPAPVMDALWRGVLRRSGDVAPHYAGLLLHLGGQAPTPFDWNQRPFLLRFNDAEPAERRKAFVELCARLGEDPEQRLALGGSGETGPATGATGAEPSPTA